MAFEGLRRFTRSLMGALRRERSQGRRGPRNENREGRVLCVASGKGGTGKTVMVVNLATAMARKGKKVLILDADLGLANAHLLLGMTPRYNLSHVLNEKTSLEEIIEPGPEGISLISGGSGISQLAALDEYHLFRLIRQVAALEGNHDLIIIDTSAGIAPQTMVFLYAAREILLVTTPDITAMTDAYAMVKTLLQRSADTRIALVANRVRSQEEADGVHEKLDRVSRRFLRQPISFWGSVPFDRCIPRSIHMKEPVLRSFPRSEASRAIDRIVRRMLAERPGPQDRKVLDRTLQDALSR
jgi:flagellar biosynthesis protein FlhG